MSSSFLIALTGGPGGGKTTLIEELTRDPDWHGRLAALPEAIYLMSSIGISPRERLFQRVMVHLQIGLENGLVLGLDSQDTRIILCHRGSLDPLAYWLDRGWPEEEFFTFTQTRREEHYQRYAAVIHLVTAADGAPRAYKRTPEAHRPETPEDAMRIDRLLQQVWCDHPHYYRIDNQGKDWSTKFQEASDLLRSCFHF